MTWLNDLPWALLFIAVLVFLWWLLGDDPLEPHWPEEYLTRERKSALLPVMINQRTDTEERCHCGAAYAGADHCPECGCEQYETINVKDCGHVHRCLECGVPAGQLHRIQCPTVMTEAEHLEAERDEDSYDGDDDRERDERRLEGR